MKRVLAIMQRDTKYQGMGVSELKSLLLGLDVDLQIIFEECMDLGVGLDDLNERTLRDYPYVMLKVPDYERNRKRLQEILRRSVLIKRLIVLIGYGKDYDQVYENRDEQLLNEECRDWNEYVRCIYEGVDECQDGGYGVKGGQKICGVFGRFDIRGKFDIKNAEKVFHIIEDYRVGYDANQKILRKIYFGVEISSPKKMKGKCYERKRLEDEADLKKAYADSALCYLICNHGRVQQNSSVFDPFGSQNELLNVLGKRKALLTGYYQNGGVISWGGMDGGKRRQYLKRQGLRKNRKQNKMEVINNSFGGKVKFDAVVSCPEYLKMDRNNFLKKSAQKCDFGETVKDDDDGDGGDGDDMGVMKGGCHDLNEKRDEMSKNVSLNKNMKKIRLMEKKENDGKVTLEENRRKKIVNLKNSEECLEIFQELLQISRKYLKIGGRLVFMYPVHEEDKFRGAESLPRCEGFKLIGISSFIEHETYSRVLITLERI